MKILDYNFIFFFLHFLWCCFFLSEAGYSHITRVVQMVVIFLWWGACVFRYRGKGGEQTELEWGICVGQLGVRVGAEMSRISP